MSLEEDKDLKDLVSKCLASKGLLGKIQAEIRAGVFVALEEEGILKETSSFANRKLKDLISTPCGLLALSLVREFIEFSDLEYTAMVFDPEIQAGTDYVFEGRRKLADKLSLSFGVGNKLPLLCHLLQDFIMNGKVNVSKDSIDVLNFTGAAKVSTDVNSSTVDTKVEQEQLFLSRKPTPIQSVPDVQGAVLSENCSIPQKDNILPEADGDVFLPALCKLPSVSKSSTNKSSHVDMKKLNSLLEFDPDSINPLNYEEDLALTSNNEIDSVAEEIGGNSHSANSYSCTKKDDVSCDTSVSQVSGQADYSEDISSH